MAEEETLGEGETLMLELLNGQLGQRTYEDSVLGPSIEDMMKAVYYRKTISIVLGLWL